MKNTILLLYLLLFLTDVNGQVDANQFIIKLSDGSQYTMNNIGAVIQSDSTINLVGKTISGNSHTFQLDLIPTDKSNRKFTKGTYYFKSMDQMLNYVPGQSIAYKLNASFLETKNESTIQEWSTDLSPERGFIQIEQVSAGRIKGKFSCELVQKLPKSDSKMTVEGSFDLPFVQSLNSLNSNEQASANATTREKGDKSSETKKSQIIFPFNVQLAAGVVYKNKLGFDLDLGSTLINIPYSKTLSSTIEFHYDFSSYQFKNIDMKAKRNSVYARIRPLALNPSSSDIDIKYFFGILVYGLYADLGYTSVSYDYLGTLTNPQFLQFKNNGFFWGWGWNFIWKPEDHKWGASIGIGTKHYNFTSFNGTQSRYKNRTISFGVVYHIK